MRDQETMEEDIKAIESTPQGNTSRNIKKIRYYAASAGNQS